jgi:hypothetical protein
VEYILYLGVNGPGSASVYDSGQIKTTSVTVSNLPMNGVTLYARLYQEINGVWQHADYTYTEGGTLTPAVLSSPTPGSTLSASDTSP